MQPLSREERQLLAQLLARAASEKAMQKQAQEDSRLRSLIEDTQQTIVNAEAERRALREQTSPYVPAQPRGARAKTVVLGVETIAPPAPLAPERIRFAKLKARIKAWVLENF
jgi:hypothetical protein